MNPPHSAIRPWMSSLMNQRSWTLSPFRTVLFKLRARHLLHYKKRKKKPPKEFWVIESLWPRGCSTLMLYVTHAFLCREEIGSIMVMPPKARGKNGKDDLPDLLRASLFSPSGHYLRPCEQSTEVEFCKFNTQADNFTPTQPTCSLCLILLCSHVSNDWNGWPRHGGGHNDR